ncbi:GNAT family N-acetyltransferase [Litorilituus lipolyticus]|uniref:N-acetyltransferase n=1 Tax=Litorilituus lipolyticus TaxID=2491017 RepID=A0A502KYN7_9GAMM|nr:GNAT family N-acetyltransferase [Litorilituus lipolyticus]TPH15589.1 N-acetyltransferase [Litorilituus lipolyticus]
MATLAIEIEEVENDDLTQFLSSKIRAFNAAHWQETKKQPLLVSIKDNAGEVVAGACAKTFGHWLMIETLWVSESLRGEGWGSKILEKLEQKAKVKGCQFSLLDTLEFQAKTFYEKYGYQVQWTQEQYPIKGAKFFMVKAL